LPEGRALDEPPPLEELPVLAEPPLPVIRSGPRSPLVEGRVEPSEPLVEPGPSEPGRDPCEGMALPEPELPGPSEPGRACWEGMLLPELELPGRLPCCIAPPGRVPLWLGMGRVAEASPWFPGMWSGEPEPALP
jgi:hypothetical protein